jgi:hypothetical protein
VQRGLLKVRESNPESMVEISSRQGSLKQKKVASYTRSRMSTRLIGVLVDVEA